LSKRTVWRIENESIGGERSLKVVIETTDPKVIEMVERAASAAGVVLAREIAGEPDA
jgi:hypothetical protein